MNQADYQGSERRPVVLLRKVLRKWPLPRGRGVLLRLARGYLDHSAFSMSLTPGVSIPSPDLDEYGVLWEFLNGPPSVWQLSFAMIRPGDVVLDVGANIGLWSLRAAEQVGETGEVHSFEPDPSVARRLQTHADFNRLRSITVVEAAVGDKEGISPFYPGPARNSGKGSLAPGLGSAAQPRSVRMVSLDAYCRAQGIEQVSVLKIDVEGAEELVLDGADELLCDFDAPTIVFESSDEHASSTGSSTRAVKKRLQRAGFEIFRLVDGHELEPVDLAQSHVQDDLLAAKGSRLNRLKRCARILQP